MPISRCPLARPVVQALHVPEDGHLLVQIEDVAGSEASGVLDVFDPVGRFLGSMELGFCLTRAGIPAIFGDTIVGVHVGSLDMPVPVRGTILRKPG